MKHAGLSSSLFAALVGIAVLFGACDNSKRHIGVSGALYLKGPEAVKDRALPVSKGDSILVAIRLIGTGTWSKPGAMSCSLAVGAFDHMVRTRAVVDHIEGQYTAVLTTDGVLEAEDKVCGKLTAVEIRALEKVAVTARIATTPQRCRIYCENLFSAAATHCIDSCQSSKYLEANPSTSASAVQKFLEQARSAGPGDTTIATGLDLVFDKLAGY